MKVVLLTVPVGNPTQPSLAIPTLAACLKAAGFQVEVWDLAIDAFHHLTSPLFLAQAYDLLEARLKTQTEHDFVKKARHAMALTDNTRSRIGWAKDVLRSQEAFYDYATYRNAEVVLSNCFFLISAAFAPTEINLSQYELEKSSRAASLLQHIDDPRSNIFLRYFQEVAAPRVKESAPDLIGISVTYRSQLPPALTLAGVVRNTLPDTPLIFGGAYLTAMADRLPQASFLRELTSGVVLFEGESTLVEIANCRMLGRELKAANFWQPGSPLPENPAIEDFDKVPCPDFSGTPLEKYLVPEPVLPVQFCRGCYWGKCAFCSVSRATRGSFRKRSINRFFGDLDLLHSKHGARIFFICDDATPVASMKALAKHIHVNQLGYRWGTEARFEAQLDEETLTALKEGGCLHLIFGFESASDRVLSLMHKGTRMDRVRRILQACRKADISVNLQSFVGFPGETGEEASLTEDFFRQNRQLYTSLGLGHFMAMDGSPVSCRPEQFGVTLLEESETQLAPWTEIETTQGMTRLEAIKRFHTMKDQLGHDDLLGPRLLMNSTGTHGLLYLDHFGRTQVDALSMFTNVLPGDPSEFVVEVIRPISFLPISDSDILLLNDENAIAEVVGQETAKAVQLINQRPQPVTEAATRALDDSRQSETDDLDLLLKTISELIYLTKAGMLGPKAKE